MSERLGLSIKGHISMETRSWGPDVKVLLGSHVERMGRKGSRIGTLCWEAFRVIFKQHLINTYPALCKVLSRPYKVHSRVWGIITTSGNGENVAWMKGFEAWLSAAAAAKSLQSCPTLCDPIDGSPQGSPSMGFSRQEHWSGLPFPSPTHESEKWKWSRSVVSDS